MLQDLRDQKNSWLIAVLFGVIILVFIFMFGMPGTDLFVNKTNPDVANVGSHKVTYDVYRSMIYRYHGDDIYNSPDYPAIARQIAEGVGVIYLLADAAREAGLRVSDEELHDYITNWESGNNDILRLGFLHKNKFSQRNYNDALSRMQLSARDYEDFKREELLARRYLILMMSSISVSDESLWQEYAIANASADLEIVRLTSTAVGATFKNLTTDEIANFVQRDKDKIEAYYNEHLGDYTTPAKAKLHQIVIQKHYAKLTNPGAKTIKTNQPTERFAIVKNQVLNEKLDFEQAFTDYDESEDKELKGVTGLLDIGIMAEPIQAAIDGKNVGEIVTAELSDRFVIAKVLERAEKVVTPLADVQYAIAEKLLNEQRIKSRTDEVAANMIALAQTGKSLEEAVSSTLYANVLADQPMAPAAEIADAPEAAADGAAADAPEAETPEMVAIPTELPIVPEAGRAKATELEGVTISSGFMTGIGVSDDLARDIRAAQPNTILSKPYKIGDDIVIVKVVNKKDASRDLFNTEKEQLRNQAIAEKAAKLVGSPEDIISASGHYGLWVRQKLLQAENDGIFTLNDNYFARLAQRRQKQAESK